MQHTSRAKSFKLRILLLVHRPELVFERHRQKPLGCYRSIGTCLFAVPKFLVFHHHSFRLLFLFICNGALHINTSDTQRKCHVYRRFRREESMHGVLCYESLCIGNLRCPQKLYDHPERAKVAHCLSG